ncbi:MAG TPA: hypothetical protein DDW27_00735, partial [Bacteroidales bacterium]|nr:hypothetical protein [Bacteroidales bacterium]
IAGIRDTLYKNIEILAGPQTDTLAPDKNRLRIINRYLVTSFDSGFYEVPPIYAELQTETGIKRFYSDYSPLQVMRVNIAPRDSTAQIFDIIVPYKAPLTFMEILPWILLAALAGALVWLIIRLLSRFRKTKPGYEPVIIKEPAHVIAFRELEKLREQKLWQKGEVKQYYSRLTEIIRQYLEDRYGVYSLELTTSETLEELLKTGFRKDETYMKLKDILNGSDLVKFAKYKPEPSENELHFENSWQFVDITRLKEEIREVSSENSNKEK